MSYRIKRCGRCNTANERTMEYCAKCGADLPRAEETSDTPPMAPPAYAVAPPPLVAIQRLNVPAEKPIECRVVDVSIPFWSMVNLLVKLAVASIPALVVLTIYAVFALALLASVGTGLGRP